MSARLAFAGAVAIVAALFIHAGFSTAASRIAAPFEAVQIEESN